MSIQKRLISLLILVFISFAAVIFFQRDINLNKNSKLLKNELNAQSQQISSDINIEGRLFQSLSVDYSYWDNMVSLASDKPGHLSATNLQFAQQNIDTALTTFKANSAWIYNTDGQIVYSSYLNPQPNFLSVPTSSSYFKTLDQKKYFDYFIDTPYGFMEVRSSTLVPTNDPDKKTKAQGYFIIARIIDNSYTKEISNLSQTEVTIVKSENKALINKIIGSNVEINHDLLNWNGNDSLYLKSKFKVAAVENIDNIFKNEIILIVSLASFLTLIISITIWLLVLRPLKAISDALTNNNPDILIKYSKSKTEFGELSRTIIQFFKQKAQIAEATADLTNANNLLKKQDSVKDDFISMISHQLGTPLAVMDGFLTLVVQGFYGKPNDKMQDALEKTLSRTRNMKGLVFDLLNISRMTAGKFFLEISDVDLGKVVAEEIEELQRQAHDRNVKLNYHPPEHNIPTLKIDEPKTRQAILNLINNAIFYSPNGVVEVYLDSDDTNVVFKVIDTGIGVPEEEKAHLFTKFFRAENARKESPNGTGIGLYLVKRVITDQHGRLIFSSQVGKGSVFG
ncbi:MAG: ATP-binding protein, partial [bacterium]